MLTPDTLKNPYVADWADPFVGTWDAWLAVRDLDGLTSSITALFRIQSKKHPEISAEQLAARNNYIELARQIIMAEREILLKEFHKRLGVVLDG